MKKQFIKTLFSIVTLAIFMVGCGSSSATPTKTAQASEEIPAAEMSGGVVSSTNGVSTTIPVRSTDGTTLASVTLDTGTGFTDAKTGKTVTETPKVVVNAEQSTTSKTEVSFVLADGSKVIPTQNVKIALTAPAGAKEGDKVTIDVPDGVTAGNTNKLTVFIVGKNGLINVIIAPRVFKNADVYVIVFAIKLAPTTGSEGGN